MWKKKRGTGEGKEQRVRGNGRQLEDACGRQMKGSLEKKSESGNGE